MLPVGGGVLQVFFFRWLRRMRWSPERPALQVTLPPTWLTAEVLETVRHSIAMLLIVGTGWLLIGLISVVDHFLDKRVALDISDNLIARGAFTTRSWSCAPSSRLSSESSGRAPC